MKSEGGVSIIPCKVNGLNLNFIFDTGAGDVSISLTEASFMLKNGYLEKSDIIGTSNYLDANGNINEGIIINLREIEIAGLKINNVKASIVKNLKAPLLLGQSAISKLGKIQIDLNLNTLTILNGNENNVDTNLGRDIKTTEVEPKNEGEYLKRGYLKFYNNDNNAAIADFSRVIDINPGNEYAFFMRGVLKDNGKDYLGAINDFSSAIEIRTDYDSAYLGRGSSKSKLKDYKGANSDLNKSIAINPKNTIAYTIRGDLREEQKDYQGALQDYNKAIELDNKNSDFYLNRGSIKDKLLDYKGAISDFNKVIILDPQNEIAFYNRGIAKFKLKDYQGSLVDYNKSIEINPESAEAYYSRGNVKTVLKDFNGAINDYTRVLEINPEHPLASDMKELVEVRLKLNEWVLVSSSLDGDKWYIKSSYVSKEESGIKIWIKTESKTMSIHKKGKSIKYNNVNTILLAEFDCKSRKSKYYSISNYDSKGHIIRSSEEESDWKLIKPESIWETVFEKVCELFK